MSAHQYENNFLTEYGNPDQIIHTHYGQLTRLAWQKLETKRIGDCHIHYREDGFCAIMKGKRIL